MSRSGPDPGLAALATLPPPRLGAPGVEYHVTSERIVEMIPSFPIAGPNNVQAVRCDASRVPGLAAEVDATFAARALPYLWKLDPGTRPSDLGRRLEGLGWRLREELTCLALPAGGVVEPAPGVALRDGLASAGDFAAAEEVAAGAFGTPVAPGAPERLRHALADPARHLVLALWDGRPAGAGWITLSEDGGFLNGGAVSLELRGRGVYRTLVAARQALAIAAGCPGLATQARPTSAPLLARLGFQAVGRTLLYARPSPSEQ